MSLADLVGGSGFATMSSATRKERKTMCLTCGCMLPHDDHGNREYLTIEDLEAECRCRLDGP